VSSVSGLVPLDAANTFALGKRGFSQSRNRASRSWWFR